MSTNENYNNDEQISLINPDSLTGYQEEENKNRHYDVTITLYDDNEDDLEQIGEELRSLEDAYDIAFTKKMVEQFPHLTNPNYISSPDSDTKKCDAFTFRPPSPPKNNSESSLDSLAISSDTNSSSIGDGKFEYISNYNDRVMFINAWQAITQTNLWDFVREPIDSFMWSDDQRLKVISKKMEELGYDGHSGISFGSTMRNMQQLAKHGENNFKELFISMHDIEEEKDNDIEANLYEHEDAMEHELRLEKLINRRRDTEYHEKKYKEARDKKLLEYMGGL